MGTENDAHGQYVEVLSSHVVIGCIATITLVLRFLARHRGAKHYGWDDWFALIATICMWGDFIMTILEYRPYLHNVEMDQLSIPNQSLLKQLSFGSIFFTAACEVTARMSLIFLYYRIFSIKRWLGWSLKIIGAISIVWILIIIVVTIFQCRPVAAVVDASVDGTCLDNQLGFVLAELINLLLDIALIPLPVKTIWKLKLPAAQRVGVTVLFLSVAGVLVTQILRMVFGYNPNPDADRGITSLSRLSLWTGLHLGLAIICACLPLLHVYLPSGQRISNSKIGLVYQHFSHWVSNASKSSSSGTRSQQTAEPSSPVVIKVPGARFHSQRLSHDEIPLTEYEVGQPRK